MNKQPEYTLDNITIRHEGAGILDVDWIERPSIAEITFVYGRTATRPFLRLLIALPLVTIPAVPLSELEMWSWSFMNVKVIFVSLTLFCLGLLIIWSYFFREFQMVATTTTGEAKRFAFSSQPSREDLQEFAALAREEFGYRVFIDPACDDAWSDDMDRD